MPALADSRFLIITTDRFEESELFGPKQILEEQGRTESRDGRELRGKDGRDRDPVPCANRVADEAGDLGEATGDHERRGGVGQAEVSSRDQGNGDE